jgi:ABC-type polysaccharide/polyol phosphate export permease
VREAEWFESRMTPVLWKYRRFILANALADLRHRFSGSVAGYLWNIFVPLAQLAVFALIFGVIFGRESDDGPHVKFSFILFLCSGLLAWNSFAETLVRASASLVGNAGYLKKLPLPDQIFVAQEAVGGFLTAVISISIFVLFSIFFSHYGPFWQWLQAIPLLILFVGFAYGLGLILACLNVFFRDVQPFMNVVVLLWMWLTPVVYKEAIFHEAASPHPIAIKLIHYNPAYHYILGFHQSLWLKQWISPGTWMACLGITLAANIIGAAVLWRLRAEIRDVL